MKNLVLALGLLMLSGCGSSSDDEVVVSAAASLSDAFRAIEAAFEQAHPDVDLVMNFGSSSSLREQLLAGAPADVFASANQSNMDRVAAEGMVRGTPIVFATNQLAIAVPLDNPGGISSVDDLTKPGILVGLCATGVPCGDFARESLALASVDVNVASDEPNVRALLTKIEAGELDAGVVYETDVRAGSVVGIGIPDEYNVATRYPIAALGNGDNASIGDQFVAFVLSPTGQQILQDHGFGAP